MSLSKIEILAPAGGFDSVISAVRSGADAVYLGAKEFSARASAKNFDNEDGFNKERLEAIDTLNRWVDELPTEPHMVRELKTTK